jgi:Cu(I)/Ag(I) efflux system membrane fusion protein
MNILRWALFAGLLALAAVSVGSYALSKRPGAGATQARKKALYHCPMHPSYTSDKPGECPICGMNLEPIAEGPDHAAMGHASDVPGLAPVQIPPERIQMIGVRTAVVERARLGAERELVGFVTPDESRLRRVQLRVAGWIRQLYVSRTGEDVTAGQPLLAIYSPELFQSEQEYLIATTSHDSSGAMPHDAGAAAASRTRLALLGVPPEELLRLERERTATTSLVLRSPATGTVLERGATDGQYVAADTPLFTVADLSRVWVLADLYERDLASVRAGDRVRFTADALPERPYPGAVEFIYPTVSTETRTVKARVVLENRDGALRPGMYGRVRVAGGGRPALAVPSEAVIRAGEHTYVFIARAGGVFQPRMVSTGLESGDRVEVLRGLAAGDTVVASASFLIDSESRLKAAIAGLGAPPSTGHPH